MKEQALIECNGTLDALLIRADGTHRNIRLSSGSQFRLIGRPIQWARALWKTLRSKGIIPITMAFSVFLATYFVADQPQLMHNLLRDPRVQQVIMAGSVGVGGLVVTGGMNFLATDMASGQASPRISSMNFHDSGTSTTAATSTQTGLTTQAGPTTRATGVQSNPATNQYQTIGLIAYTGNLAITEWGLFNQAAQGGTMWDRRTFAAVNVANGDSIQFTYVLTLTAGGS